MSGDALERELYIAGAQLQRLGKTFTAMAHVLRGEREDASARADGGRETPDVSEQQNKGRGDSGPPLPF